MVGVYSRYWRQVGFFIYTLKNWVKHFLCVTDETDKVNGVWLRKPAVFTEPYDPINYFFLPNIISSHVLECSKKEMA